MANRCNRLVNLGKKGLAPPPFSKSMKESNIYSKLMTPTNSKAVIDDVVVAPEDLDVNLPTLLSQSETRGESETRESELMTPTNSKAVIDDVVVAPEDLDVNLPTLLSQSETRGESETRECVNGEFEEQLQSNVGQKRKRSSSSSSSRSNSSSSSDSSSTSSTSTTSHETAASVPVLVSVIDDVVVAPEDLDVNLPTLLSQSETRGESETRECVNGEFEEKLQSNVGQKRKRSSSSSSSSSNSSSSSDSSSTSSTSTTSHETATRVPILPNKSPLEEIDRSIRVETHEDPSEKSTTELQSKEKLSPEPGDASKNDYNDVIIDFLDFDSDATRVDALSSPTILQTRNLENTDMYEMAKKNSRTDFSVTNTSEREKENKKPTSPVEPNNDEEDDFSGGSSDEYQPPRRTAISESSSESSSSQSCEKPKKGKKRLRNEKEWKKNVRKELKNSGKKYTSSRGQEVSARTMKASCLNCRYSCGAKFSNDQRREIFDCYWALGCLQRQRDFLTACVNVQESTSTCRRVKNPEKPRSPNCWFSFMKNGQNIRVCKKFLMNTLGIAERTLRTVIEARLSDSGMAPADNRGRHGHQPRISPEVIESIHEHINSITRVESHYLRANTSREFIDGGLTLAALHRDYECKRQADNKEVASLYVYGHVFNTQFNISFFVPKKDQCNFCVSYNNASQEEQEKLKEKHEKHHTQKILSRAEKAKDINICKESGNNVVVAIYDLQAQLPVPIGNSSAFFYKSKLNCYNFTITNIKQDSTNCYFWYEGLGSKGATEIGTCVYEFLKDVAEKCPNCDVIFYTDNCGGQQKNRFLFSMYYYAVQTLAIRSICHKFLITGHTQNEGDNAHSVIEKSIKRAKRSGPIYVPDQYVRLIRDAKKKGNPYIVKEMNYSDFYDLKALADQLGVNYNKDCKNDPIKVSELSMIRFTNNSKTYEYKLRFDEEWIQVNINNVRGRKRKITWEELQLKQAYQSKIDISKAKKDDLLDLLKSNIIPKYYEGFYNSL